MTIVTTATTATTGIRPGGHGHRPPIPTRFARTATVQDAEMKVRLSVMFGDISAFEGDPGLGKTTTLAYSTFLQQGLDTDWRYCVLPLKGNPKSVMSAVYAAILGKPGARSRTRDMENAIIDQLVHSDIGLVVDEVHHCGVDGLQQLRFLHDAVITQCGRGFPLIIGGVDLTATTSKAPELRGRISRWVRFYPLDSIERVTEFASVLHPRLAATTRPRIVQLNTRVGHGEKRGWVNVAKHIDVLPSTTNLPEAGLSSEDVNQLIALTN